MQKKIAVIGLGYVGLPLAFAFSKKFDVLAYDRHSTRVNELKKNFDRLDQLSSSDLKQATQWLTFSDNPDLLFDYNTYIITVPTPVTAEKKPDLSYLINASKTVGHNLKKGDIVIYESTVYPGCTEDDCVPVLEKASGLKFNTDFFCGYSPERINPGDKDHSLTNIRKITSGSTPEISTEVDELYQDIIVAGTLKASSIKVAEAAKVIENTQRDVNIALINEFALIFNKLDIDT